MNILMAEDNPVIQMTYQVRIKLRGYHIDVAYNGRQAVDYARNNEGKYDLCLMDVHMPKMSGLEATKLIRKTVKYLPILGLSSNPGYKKRCLEARMDDFIEKSCLPDRFFSKIAQLTVKLYKLISKPDSLQIIEEMPVDKQHADELRELAKQDLCKMTLMGSNASVIVHKNIPNKIAHDFIEKELEISIFLNRNSNNPGECHLYRSSGLTPVIHVDEDLYKEKLMNENEEIKQHSKMILKKQNPS